MYWIVLLIPTLILIAGLVFAIAGRRPAISMPGTGDTVAASAEALAKARIRSRLTLLLAPAVGGLATGVVVWAYNDREDVGGILDRTSVVLAAPLLSVTLAVLLLGYVPVFRDRSVARSADVSRRTLSTFARRADLVTTSIIAGALLLLTVGCGLVASPDGRTAFYDYGPDQSAGAGGEFPGWHYGVPVLISLAILAAASGLSLARVARAPRPTDSALRLADEQLRRQTSRAILNVAALGGTLALMFVLIMAAAPFFGIAERDAVDRYGTPIPPDITARILDAASWAAIGISALLLIASVVFLVRAVSAVMQTPFRLIAEQPVAS